MKDLMRALSVLFAAMILAATLSVAQQRGAKQAAPAQQLNINDAFTPPSDVKIDSVQVAPFVQGVQFTVSQHGIHVAIGGASGSRQVVYYDNVAGPKFDQLFMQNATPIVLSPDGRRYAYCGAVGNDWVVMVDGKELARGTVDVGGGNSVHRCTLAFTSNGKHVYFTSVQNWNNPASAPSRVVWDGKPGPVGYIDGNVVISPDGDHFAYMVTDPATKRNELIVDGQPAGYGAGNPQWTATSHLFTQRVSRGQTGPVTDVLVDGKPFMRATQVWLYMAPVGDLVIGKVSGAPGTPSFLVAGNKRLNGSDIPSGVQIGDVAFSPDGKHFGVRYSVGNQAYAYIDGTKGPNYQRLDSAVAFANNSNISFSPDSSKSVYMGFNNNSDYLVYGGQESDALPNGGLGVFSRVGGHFLWTASGIVALDGKILQLPKVSRNASQATELGFSPDGAHYAMVVRNAGVYTLYLDGVPQSAYYWAGAATTQENRTGAYAFSPDSRHIAYLCRSPAAGNDLYLCIDNKAVRVGGVGGGNVTFTEDSQHLVWTMDRPASGWRAFVDGKPVADGFGRLSAATWQAGPDPSSWSFLVQGNDGLKRITVTPAPGTNFTSFVGGPSTLGGGR